MWLCVKFVYVLVKRKRNHHSEISKIFWRAYTEIAGQNNIGPTYKEIWDAVRQDVLNDQGGLIKRKYDPNELIEENSVDSSEGIEAKLQWFTDKVQGTYRLSSLPALLSRLKNNPPKL